MTVMKQMIWLWIQKNSNSPGVVVEIVYNLSLSSSTFLYGSNLTWFSIAVH